MEAARELHRGIDSISRQDEKRSSIIPAEKSSSAKFHFPWRHLPTSTLLPDWQGV